MGVTGLWDLLEDRGCYDTLKSLSSLRDDYGLSRIAVDLSIWVVEAMHALRHVQKRGTTENAFLLSIFYKVRKITAAGINLVAVIENDVPNSLKKQQRIREGKGVITYNKFRQQLHLAAQLLQSLGVKVVKSKGEAEALCAALNHHNICDGVITEDSDVFLFGGKVVIRGLKLNDRIKKGQAGIGKIYHMDKIKSKLGVNRMGLVSISLFSGSDFTKGVERLSCKKALPFIKYLNEKYGDNDVDRSDVSVVLSVWCEKMKHGEKENVFDIKELRIWEKIVNSNSSGNFPDKSILSEYRNSISKEIEHLKSLSYQSFDQTRPNLSSFYQFMQRHRGWGRWTAKKKLLPMLINFDLRTQASKQIDDTGSNHIRPNDIKRTFKRYGVTYLECTWEHTLDHCDDLYCLEGFVHEVPLQLLKDAYPATVERFLERQGTNRRPNHPIQTKLDSWKIPKTPQTLSTQSNANSGDDSIEILGVDGVYTVEDTVCTEMNLQHDSEIVVIAATTEDDADDKSVATGSLSETSFTTYFTGVDSDAQSQETEFLYHENSIEIIDVDDVSPLKNSIEVKHLSRDIEVISIDTTEDEAEADSVASESSFDTCFNSSEPEFDTNRQSTSLLRSCILS